MINENLLKASYVAKGLTQEEVAEKLGITTNTFRFKVKNNTLDVRQMDILIELLDIKNPIEIFFSNQIT